MNTVVPDEDATRIDGRPALATIERLALGEDVPIPTLPLEETVNQFIPEDEATVKIGAVAVVLAFD
jgi:23S rRNA C2498 (ribose-2'-O)-methylase RlmM